MTKRYVTRVAESLINKFGANLEGIDYSYSVAQQVAERYGKQVGEEIRAMRPAMLARLAMAGVGRGRGRTSLYQVHCETYLDKYGSGRSLITTIAWTAVIAEMTDVLRSSYPVDSP